MELFRTLQCGKYRQQERASKLVIEEPEPRRASPAYSQTNPLLAAPHNHERTVRSSRKDRGQIIHLEAALASGFSHRTGRLMAGQTLLAVEASDRPGA
jgi:hypothetical protein